MSRVKLLFLAFAAVGVLVTGGFVLELFGTFSPASQNEASAGLSQAAQAGKLVFDKNCAECHGPEGSGSTKGPPLIHRIYNPGHHSDMSFFMAARNGVKRHHWDFGDMPPQPEVNEQDVAQILVYIRSLQQAAGIGFEQHKM